MGEPIYKIKNVKLEELNREWPLEIWFYEMVQKSVEELTLDDLGRMLRQDVFVDIAVPATWKTILAEPFEAEKYEGKLIVALTKVFKHYPNMKDYKLYECFVKKVQEQIDEYN